MRCPERESVRSGRDLSDATGSAPVEFVLVGLLLTVLTLGVLQLALAVYVRNVVQGAMGLVLSPLSQALEVKLEGSLAQPRWSFALSPLSILKSLTAGGTENTGKQDPSPTPPSDEKTGQEPPKKSEISGPSP